MSIFGNFDFLLCEDPLGGLFCPRGLDMAVLRLSPLFFLSWCKEYLGQISCLYHNLHDCCANVPEVFTAITRFDSQSFY